MSIDVSQFIDEVKKHTELYDKTLDVDRNEKISIWKQIGAVIFPDWHTCSKAEEYNRVLDMQRKWRSIRDQLNRELRRRKIPNKHRKTYRYFTQLKFMLKDEDLEQLAIAESLDESLDTPDDSDQITQNDTQPTTRKHSSDSLKPKPKRHKLKSKKKNISPLPPSIPGTPIPPSDFFQSDKDSDRLFLLSFVDEMSKLPSNIKMWARAEIARVMQEAVSRNYDEDTLSLLPMGDGQYPVNIQMKRRRMSHDDDDTLVLLPMNDGQNIQVKRQRMSQDDDDDTLGLLPMDDGQNIQIKRQRMSQDDEHIF